ncbi:glutamyl-Q tRNA(Asp) ligase [Rhodomicrobium udaipurense JA643]|uniref:Glutamyl-Q tRNA(Asp) synthetase n=1 Tax=Rhodomicrobium udaipurense TaxID=1202716 RepID=A0A8I1KHE3_9HYPH|nr:tRNA glutamyl-Q(34) synthetase GluQRS [Rhodomicrobium udaipurense]KAI95811.1 glutamyl-Q tRNA(Asp) ligase [Rhodomicrobium udaipurense JA643]MBJ7543625.1 tRNA glutamyl-Q(34) synthetase GluQRS [Rhodomicrobium udaipurense]
MTYIGRFAPSPTGPLHFGSLVAAVASYCDARAAGGRWLVRMEDIDPPREMPGAARRILDQLAAYGFEWDGDVLFQSTRLDAYAEALDALRASGHVFWCNCSRADLARRSGAVYPGTCRAFTAPRDDAAVRIRVPPGTVEFADRVFGPQREDVAETVGDFVVRRRDGLFAYQLAVVVDDDFQGVTDVVRGADLLDNTARQIVLQRLLGLPTPRYMHLPLALNADGSKLSKQTHAQELPTPADSGLLWQALAFLGQDVPPGTPPVPCADVLGHGVRHWTGAAVPRSCPMRLA